MSYTHVSDILLSRELIDNCKFIIYKYTNTNENRTFYAVGMKNKKRKDPIFSKCNIRTSLCEVTPPSVSQSWEQTIIEMECSPTSSTCVEIEKCEILDFEPRQVRVPSKSMRDNKNCYNTIALDSDDSTFFSYQVGNMRGSEYANFETKEFGKVFNLRSKTCGSMEEINIYTKKLIESYRNIFGSLCTTATILYTKVDDNKYVTSIAVYEKILPNDELNVEEDIF